MPITFSMNHDGRYFVAQYKEVISDADLLDDWKSFINGFDTIPSIDQLADFSDADLSSLTNTGIQALADYFIHIYRENNIASMKTAIYAPQALSFGLSRVYEALTGETDQEIGIFEDREKAMQWLTTDK